MAEKLAEQPEQPAPVPENPKKEILDLVVKNIYSDAILQSIGLIILGEAIRRNPILNDRSFYDEELDFDKLNPEDYEIRHVPVASTPTNYLLESLDNTIDTVAVFLGQVLANPRRTSPAIVAGTLRINVHMTTPTADNWNTELSFNLFWIVKKHKE